MAGALANPAIDDGLVVRAESGLALIDRLKLLGRPECGVVIGRAFPRKALGARDMPATQDALLRILGHMSHLSFEFTRRPHIDERLLILALLERLVKKGPNLVVVAL